MNPREEILALFSGQRPKRFPCFSGLICVTSAGLENVGVHLHDAHADSMKMSRAAASTFKLTGIPSAVVPLDLCVEAEALGAEIDFRADSRTTDFPRPVKPLFERCEQVDVTHTSDGRIPLVWDAIRFLKQDIGDEVIIGAFVPGPFTLLSLLVKPDQLMLDLKRDPDSVHAALDSLVKVLAKSAAAYHQAGADMLTIHEMGGSPGVLGPKRFETFVLPPLQKLIAFIPKPRVLSVCGDTNGAMPLLALAGPDAISVDQLNGLAVSRQALPGTLIFGNIDPVAVLANSTVGQVGQAVSSAIAAGVDAVWPGCDLYPPTPLENLRAMMEVTCA